MSKDQGAGIETLASNSMVPDEKTETQNVVQSAMLSFLVGASLRQSRVNHTKLIL